jgi:hypothetical protein
LKIVGIILIIAGIAGVIYGGFSYTTQKKAVDLGPIQIDKTVQHTVPIPPLLGLVGIVGGSALLYFAAKEAR